MTTFTSALPCLTADVPPVGAAIRRHLADFEVDEIPAYLPSGDGDHVYFRIEKSGLATSRAVREIARALGAAPRDVGFAGQKDAGGVTRQTLSLEHVDPDRVRALDLPRIRVLEVSRHRNKLRMGHLKGNRFRLLLREVAPDRVGDIRTVLALLGSRGAPNYFGDQRFGLRGDTGETGRALLAGDFGAAAEIVAGRPGDADSGPVLEARTLFARGAFEEAARAWPRGFDEARRVCLAMLRFRGDPRRAMMSLDRRALGFYVSAFQSQVFNAVVAARVRGLDRVMQGDLAWKHDSGAVFRVDDPAAEQQRTDAFEISPTGPLFGPRMTEPRDEPARMEDDALASAGVDRRAFEAKGPLSCPGGRRPLRFRPEGAEVEPGSDEHGPFLELRFTLSPGCYATAILREIGKDRLQEDDPIATRSRP
ncbi:MAG: tRNA pseudouridine(13) synthase TruD [Deltaproteobacteria bacterium]|nr:tRNA pseudouridine(13) synthase TruD [Deltaproteobacteria bacterium]